MGIGDGLFGARMADVEIPKHRTADAACLLYMSDPYLATDGWVLHTSTGES